MSIEVKIRRGTTAEHATFTGAVGEITVDTDKKVVVVHDGATAGGNPQDNAERIKSKAVVVDDFTGKDGYIMAYDETNDRFYLKKDEGSGGGGYTPRGFDGFVNDKIIISDSGIMIPV
jgi:hypothetical protein